MSGRPLTITGVNALNGFIRLIGVHFRRYTPPVGSAAPTMLRSPFDATPSRLSFALKPNAWVGLQLDYEIRNPCVHGAQTIYDRTVEVTYAQAGGRFQEVPMVPQHISRRGACDPAS